MRGCQKLRGLVADKAHSAYPGKKWRKGYCCYLYKSPRQMEVKDFKQNDMHNWFYQILFCYDKDDLHFQIITKMIV